MLNFGKIKNAFNGIMVEAIVTKNDASKQIFKKYVSTIKENKILKTQFLVYKNIEDKVELNESKALQFVNDNIELLKSFKTKELNEANAELAKSISLSQDGESKYDKQELHENISKLITLKISTSNIDEIIEARTFVVNHIMNNKAKEINESIDLPPSMVSSIMVDKYNEKYASLDESDRSALKSIIDSNDEQKKEMYSVILRECIDLIDGRLGSSDVEAKDKLLRVKDKLLNDKKELDENFIPKISKLIELKSSLK